ncbi:MAG: zinc-ribbon domain-containing protein [Vicinamibacteria bacterium]|nr:zinc-ribbon domain-containing protein [Vicinamibacteria bacterium]
MIVECPSCQSRYRFDESKLGGRVRVKTRCAKCGGSIEIDNPGGATLPPEPEPEPGADTRRASIARPKSEATGHDLEKMGVLELPRDRRFSIAIIQGPATGTTYQLQKVKTTVGRSGCDINLDDAEASRQHAVIEVFGDHAALRDLGSTNGTFVDGERITTQVLENLTEFRIGAHVLMFISTVLE